MLCTWYSARPWRGLRRPSIPRNGVACSSPSPNVPEQYRSRGRGMALVRRYTREHREGGESREYREIYTRNDLGGGVLHGKVVSFDELGALGRLRTAGEPYAWALPDTNVALHQIDVLTAMERVILTQTVLEEARHRDLEIAKRLGTSLLFLGRLVRGPASGPYRGRPRMSRGNGRCDREFDSSQRRHVTCF